MKDIQILDHMKHVDELDARLKVQKKMYEAVHQDRNSYRSVLISGFLYVSFP